MVAPHRVACLILHTPPEAVERPRDATLNGAISIYTSDVDLDGDTDVVGLAYFGNQVVLWLNDGRDRVQWTEQLNDDY
jgi:hypothetical protein